MWCVPRINEEDGIISRDLWSHRSPYLNPCDLSLWGKLKSVVFANNPHDLDALKQNIGETIYNVQQCELLQVSRNLFKRIQTCLTAQRTDTLNISYNDEYNFNYYISLIINERTKQCVLTVLTARLHFHRQVAQRSRKNLLTVISMSNQPVLWTLYTNKLSW
jgi:hypothetical protein